MPLSASSPLRPAVESAPAPRRAPSPPGDPVLGHVRRMRHDPLRFLLRAMVEHGDVVRVQLPGLVAHLVSHPDHVRHVLHEHHKNYDKQTRAFDKLRLVLGNGLLTSEGSFWLRQRRIAQPAFHRQRIAGFGAVMVRAAQQTVARWEAAAIEEQPVDVAAEMMGLTLQIVGETLFDTDVSNETEVVREAMGVLLDDLNDRITRLFDPPLRWPTPGNRRFHRAVGALEKIMAAKITERRARPGGHDLLSMLIEARDEVTGEGMSDRQLRDEVMTLFAAGHETTANALAWTFYLLSQSPPVERRLRAELRTVLGERPPTIEDLPKLEYTRMVIQEAMRLYPPAWIVGRRAVAADTLGGYEIPAGSLVFTSPWVTHRHPALWDNPEGFDPERFEPARAAARPALAYFPFGAGPRQCVGNTFALIEAQLVLATIARRVRLELVPGHPVEPEPLITLRPKHGLRMTVHREA